MLAISFDKAQMLLVGNLCSDLKDIFLMMEVIVVLGERGRSGTG